MQIPEFVEQIIAKLNGNGYEAFAVGGCVRDVLLGREPEDWDITTSARPEQVKELFHRTIDTGIMHGTVTIMHGKDGYEVTTYRIDGEYEDGRHPSAVSFTSDLLEDLRRRDFTINAMAYSHETGIIDAFGGGADLEAGIIRCVGIPMERFTEDALRILRAIRFSAQLGFSIDPDTWEAILAVAPGIGKVSRERIQMELTKLLLSDRPEQLRQVYEAGISRYISPSFEQVPWQTIAISNELPKVKFLRWAAFLRIVSAEQAVQILKDLKLDNDTIRKVKTLAAWCKKELSPTYQDVRRAMSQMEPEVWEALMELNTSPFIQEISNSIRAAGDCLGLQDLAVKGHDLVAAGMRPGRQIGETLQFLLEWVLEHPEENKKEVLLELVKSASCFEQE